MYKNYSFLFPKAKRNNRAVLKFYHSSFMASDKCQYSHGESMPPKNLATQKNVCIITFLLLPLKVYKTHNTYWNKKNIPTFKFHKSHQTYKIFLTKKFFFSVGAIIRTHQEIQCLLMTMSDFKTVLHLTTQCRRRKKVNPLAVDHCSGPNLLVLYK